jgi:hypothetical protein
MVICANPALFFYYAGPRMADILYGLVSYRQSIHHSIDGPAGFGCLRPPRLGDTTCRRPARVLCIRSTSAPRGIERARPTRKADLGALRRKQVGDACRLHLSNEARFQDQSCPRY